MAAKICGEPEIENELIGYFVEYNEFKRSSSSQNISERLKSQFVASLAIVNARGVDNFSGNVKNQLCKAIYPEGSWIWTTTEFSKSSERYKYEIFFISVVPVIISLLDLSALDEQVYSCFISFIYKGYPWLEEEMCLKSEKNLCTIKDSNINKFHNDDFIRSLMHQCKEGFSRQRIKSSKQNRYAYNDSEEEEPLWKLSPYIICYIEYAVKNISWPNIKEYWSILIPSILNLIDDHDPMIKSKGCHIAQVLFESLQVSKEGQKHFRTTGVDSIFVDAIKPCLSYLPPGTEAQLSVHVVGGALTSLISLSKNLEVSNNYLLLDLILRDGVFQGLMHSGQYVDLTITLLTCSDEIITSLGTRTVKHLKPLIMAFVNILCDPFIAVCEPLIQQTCHTCLEVIKFCWFRIETYKYDILRGICTAWKRLAEENHPQLKTIDSLKSIVIVLKDIYKESIQYDYDLLLQKDKSLEKLLAT